MGDCNIKVCCMLYRDDGFEHIIKTNNVSNNAGQTEKVYEVCITSVMVHYLALTRII